MKSREAMSLEGLKLITLERHLDERGSFIESFVDWKIKERGVDARFKQDNQVFSKRKGTLRGLHYQELSHSQAKLINVIKGKILDIVVDLRKGSKTFGYWKSLILTSSFPHLLFVPAEFAHGYITLEDDTFVVYKVDRYYNRKSEKGIRWNDPILKINWLTDKPILSQKDRRLPKFNPEMIYF